MPNRIKTTLGGPRPYKNLIGLKKISGTKVLAFPPQCWQQVLMLKPFFFITDAPKKYLTVFHSKCMLPDSNANISQACKTFLGQHSGFSASMLATDINVETFFLHH